MWGPASDVCWFINPINYSYKYSKLYCSYWSYVNPNLATERGPHMLLFYTAGTHAFRVPLPGSAEVLEVDVTCKSTEIQATYPWVTYPWWFNCDSIVISWRFNGDLMVINGDWMVIQWVLIMVIYPLVNIQKTMEISTIFSWENSLFLW